VTSREMLFLTLAQAYTSLLSAFENMARYLQLAGTSDSLQPVATILFCPSSLQRLSSTPLAQSDLFAALAKLSEGDVGTLLPSLLQSYLAAVGKEGKDVTSERSQEHLVFGRKQTAAFDFLDASLGTKAGSECLSAMLDTVGQNSLYAIGATDATAVLSKICGRADSTSTGLFGRLVSLNLSIVQPFLPKVFASLLVGGPAQSNLPPPDSDASHFFGTVRPLFIKNRALRSYLTLLFQCPALPVTELEAIARELAVEEALGLHILADVADRLDQTTELSAASVDLACVLIRNAQPAFAEKPTALALLSRCIAQTNISSAIDSGMALPVIRLYSALQARVADLADELDEHAAGGMDASTTEALQRLVKKGKASEEVIAAVRSTCVLLTSRSLCAGICTATREQSFRLCAGRQRATNRQQASIERKGRPAAGGTLRRFA
jgi:hypothetical protein